MVKKGNIWKKIVIGVSLVLTVSLVWVYQLQAQKKSDLDKEIASIEEQSAMLQSVPIPDLQQLSSQYEGMQQDIASAHTSLDKAIGSNGVTALVGIAKDTSVKLVDTKAGSISTVPINEISYNKLSLKMRVVGNSSNLTAFIERVSRELGIIEMLVFQVPQEGSNDFTADLEVRMYSAKE